MEDIAPQLLESIRREFSDKIAANPKIRALYKRIQGGKATYADAEDYAYLVGQALSQAFGNHLSSAVLPDGRMYYNIADRVLRPLLEEDHGIISDAAAKVQNEELSYFLDDQAQAELSAEGIKGAITKAYYTVGGYLAVQFDLGNGMATAQHPTSVYVELANEDDTMLATGFTDAIDEEFVIEAGTHGSFFLYISPEFVKVTDDDLDQLSYTITVDSIAA